MNYSQKVNVISQILRCEKCDLRLKQISISEYDPFKEHPYDAQDEHLFGNR